MQPGALDMRAELTSRTKPWLSITTQLIGGHCDELRCKAIHAIAVYR